MLFYIHMNSLLTLPWPWVTVAVLFGEPRIYGGEFYFRQINTAWCASCVVFVIFVYLYIYILYICHDTYSQLKRVANENIP